MRIQIHQDPLALPFETELAGPHATGRLMGMAAVRGGLGGGLHAATLLIELDGEPERVRVEVPLAEVLAGARAFVNEFGLVDE